MTHDVPPDIFVSWRAPEDATRVAFRTLRDDLRTELAGLATVSSPAPPQGSGPEGRDWDPDDVSIHPRADGAARVWWGHSAKQVQVGVGLGRAFTNWQLARDDQAVAFARRVVDAAVAGRVELGQGEVDNGGRLGPVRVGYCRVTLADGTVLHDPRLRTDLVCVLGPPGPVEWTTWTAPYA